MCATLAALKAVNSIGRSPNISSLKTLRMLKSVPHALPPIEPITPHQAGTHLQAQLAHKTLTMKSPIRPESIEVAEVRASIDEFEKRLKHILTTKVQYPYFFHN
jgi:hypothetical protein